MYWRQSKIILLAYIFLVFCITANFNPMTLGNSADAPSAYFSLELSYEEGLDNGKEMAVEIGTEMSKIGMKISVNEKSTNDLEKGYFDVAIFKIPETGLATMFDLYSSDGSKNYAGINNSTLDNHLNFAISETNESAKRDYVKQLADLVVWEVAPLTGIFETTDGQMVAVAFDIGHSRLMYHYIRLAIAHIIDRENFQPTNGKENCLAGLLTTNTFYPNAAEWVDIGLPLSQNVETSSGKALYFQRQITYDLDKGWCFMEKAGYDMDPWRNYYSSGAEGIAPDTGTATVSGFSFVVGAICLFLVLLCRKRWKLSQK